MNLMKDVQDLCIENYITSLNELKDLNTWKDLPYSWIRSVNIVK